ncbi:MAG: hypothetical protein R2759_11590 [Bacteroidales bacterium]
MVNQIGVFIAPAILFAYLYNRRAAAYLHTNNGFGLQFFILSVVLIIMVIPFINRLVEINEQMQLPDFLGVLSHGCEVARIKPRNSPQHF